MKTILSYLFGGGIFLILAIFAYGAVRMNLSKGNVGFPVTRRKGGRR